MNREQLERLGEGGLRQMAQRVGLRGARHLDRSLLIIGLTAYFARQPSEDDGDPVDEPLDAPVGATEIPPALSTETMARLLESQGEATHASAVRARLAAHAGAHAPADARTVGAPTPATAPAVQVAEVAPDGVELTWEGAHDAQSGLVLRLWTGDGDPVQWELPVTTASGHMRFDPPPHTVRLCVALGRLSPEGFLPEARSPVLCLPTATPGDERP